MGIGDWGLGIGSSLFISMGGRSEVTTICLLASYRLFDFSHGASHVIAADVTAGDVGLRTLKDGVQSATQSSFFIIRHCQF